MRLTLAFRSAVLFATLLILGQRFSLGASPWADFVEPGFPFYSSVLDARKVGGFTNNLTPRGLILAPGNDCWICFDTELLRIAAIWEGKGVSPISMSQGSYHQAGQKAAEGQERLPKMVGRPWLLNGIYPGAQLSQLAQLSDPRPAGPELSEVGRGPIDFGRFKGVRLSGSDAVLEYEVDGVSMEDSFRSRNLGGTNQVERDLRISAHPRSLWVVLGQTDPDWRGSYRVQLDGRTLDRTEAVSEDQGVVRVRIGPSESAQVLQVTWGLTPEPSRGAEPKSVAARAKRWPEVVMTKGITSIGTNALVLDEIELPNDNPWKRNVRIADLAFFRDGRAAVVTFDGDIWLLNGLQGQLRTLQWRRFASGFHEPLALAIRNEEIFVFDRNGIWRVLDQDEDGEADRHELFCNLFTQTAETREFACGMRLTPDGGFVIAKGGQESGSLGRDNGSIIQISPDGRTLKLLGHGLRQPFLGVNPVTGLVTASDQQGHYIPSTPLHIIRDNQYYGFIPTFLPKEKYPAPIADPLTWIPHPINASGASQVWLEGARMGPFNGSLIHLAYYRPEIFRVLLNSRGSRTQAAVVSLTKDLSFPVLNGAVNPADGQLYVTGFQIWGTTAPKISGMARYRYTGAVSTVPREVIPMDKGILVRFDARLDPTAATNARNFSVERWNYQRTASYGSPHFKLDGTKGQEFMGVSSVYLSKDGKALLVGIPGMKPVMQMRLGWTLQTVDGLTAEQNAYFTPYELTRFDPAAEGFADVVVDLHPVTARREATGPATAEEGRRLYELMGCVACHSLDGSTVGKVGPSWRGLFESERVFSDGSKARATDDYIRESIREPALRVVKGFDKSDTGMPSYEGVLTPEQIESLVLFIKTLR